MPNCILEGPLGISKQDVDSPEVDEWEKQYSMKLIPAQAEMEEEEAAAWKDTWKEIHGAGIQKQIQEEELPGEIKEEKRCLLMDQAPAQTEKEECDCVILDHELTAQ